CHVLGDDESRSNSPDDVEHPGPSPPFVRDAFTPAGVGEGLTGETSSNNVNSWSWLCPPPFDGGADVVMLWHLRPVSCQHLPAEVVQFHLADDGHAGPF